MHNVHIRRNVYGRDDSLPTGCYDVHIYSDSEETAPFPHNLYLISDAQRSEIELKSVHGQFLKKFIMNAIRENNLEVDMKKLNGRLQLLYMLHNRDHIFKWRINPHTGNLVVDDFFRTVEPIRSDCRVLCRIRSAVEGKPYTQEEKESLMKDCKLGNLLRSTEKAYHFNLPLFGERWVPKAMTYERTFGKNHYIMVKAVFANENFIEVVNDGS